MQVEERVAADFKQPNKQDVKVEKGLPGVAQYIPPGSAPALARDTGTRFPVEIADQLKDWRHQ